MKKTLHIIPHSHWDREWYLPFEKHRVRLVQLFDDLIRVMEENEDYTYYHLDGQFVVIEDYLQIRPQMRERLYALIRADRIQIGPWYVLQDEYLTSGEANVRNMLYGIKLCREIGAETVETGYFPDAFGNISQAPQILRGFGMDNAVFGRGLNDVGADNQLIKENGITKSELIWRAPDGSEVIGVLFAGWYHNAMELPEEPEALRERIHAIAARAERFALTDHLLGMNGCDHQPVQMNLHEIIKTANEIQDEVEVKQSNFKDYIAAIRPYKDTLPVCEGELNGQLTAGRNPLTCTASAHIDIKQMNYRTQHLIERLAEPASVLAKRAGGEYDEDLFLYAWKTLMQNHPHDSICTCSCDEVYEEMKTRFAKASACAEELRDGAIAHLAACVDTSKLDAEKAIVVFCFEPNRSVGTVKANVDFALEDDVSEIAIFDENGREVPAKIRRIEKQFVYTLPRHTFRTRCYVNRFEVEMQVESHGIGYRVFAVRKQSPSVKTAVKYTQNSMENECLRVVFNADGSLDITDKRSGRVFENQHVFEDSRDCGNLYNYVQPEGDAAITSRGVDASISLHEVTAWSVTFKVDVPLAIDADITTYVTLCDGCARVEFRTVVENRMENHRLRALFPTNLNAEHVYAEGQFDVVRRDITPSPVWKNPSNVQRCQAFAAIESEDGGKDAVLVANRGLFEYEVLRDGKNTLAVTLLRAIDKIGDWGVFPTPLGQKKGTWTLEYAFVPYQTDARAQAYNEGYGFAYPTLTALGTDSHVGTMPAVMDYVNFDTPYIRMTAFKKAEDGEAAILRLFNTQSESAVLNMAVAPVFKQAKLVNLAEEELSDLEIKDGKITMEIGAKKIVTIALQ